MRFADCVPIFLYDPVRKAVGLVHAGWKGTVGKAAAVAVQAFQVAFGCQSKDILAGIGPSICRDCYPVGSDVVQEVEKAFGPKAERYIQHSNGIPHFDLWSANQDLLASAGVTQIELAQICTATNTQDWYSHRAEEGETGRFGVIIALKG
jgi:YfiH family protein